jgi:multiple sugar transport system substrate-binding protein
MKKLFLALLALLMVSAMVFAGGSPDTNAASGSASSGTQVVRWSFWGGESRIKNTQLVIDKFTEQTGIIVAAEPAPGTGDHFTKFATQFAGGNAADIVQLGGDFSNLNVGMDVGQVLLPLDEFVASGIIDTSKDDASAIAKGTVDGKLYALPVAANVPGLIYNKSLLQRVGAPLPNVSMTWQEFHDWLVAVKAKLPAGVWPMTDNSANSDQSVFFGYWMRDNGTKMWDGTKSYTTAADAKKYFDLWAGYRAEGLIPDAMTSADYAETNESTSAMIAGKTVVCFVWSNQVQNYQNATQDELDLIEFPNAAVTKQLWTNMSQMMAINKNSKNPQAAAAWINYRVNNPETWKIMGADPGIPISSDCRAVLPTDNPVINKISAYMDVAAPHSGLQDPNMPSDSQWNSRLYTIAQSVAYGQITTTQAGDQVVALIKELTAQ